MARSLLTPLVLLALALGASACGGDDEPTSGSPSSSAASSDASSSSDPSETEEESEGAETPEESDAPEPGDEGEGDDDGDADDAAVVASMQTSLDALVDPKTSPEQKASRVVGGRDLAPLFRQFEQGSGEADIVFSVSDPEVEGRTAVALVGATNNGQPLAAPERTPFVLADGEWRLERRTVCIFAQQVGLRCP